MLLYLILGLILGLYIFDEETLPKRIWLGGVIGMMLLMWSHVPFSFFLGFSRLSHLFGLLLSMIITAGTVFLKYKKNAIFSIKPVFKTKIEKSEIWMLSCVVPFMIIAGVLLSSHTLRFVDGAYYTGQCGYGDMNMHLGFITSIAKQEMFPPTYSIMAGEPLNYPFLCDSISASLYLFGCPLRLSYNAPMFVAFLLVFVGIWYLAEAILKSAKRASLAYILFVLDGGFGIMYFIDGSTFKNWDNFKQIFTEFYHMPTNYVDANVRWVNIIADMLLPQRATLFGWMCLFAIVYLLYRAVFESKKYYLIAGIMAGLLPMVHTHSYFAIGLIALAWLIISCIKNRFNREIIMNWLKFGIPALILSVPQLLKWTFNADLGESFLRFTFNWVNAEGGDSWLWFWVKNLGIVFLLIPTAFIHVDRRKKAVTAGAWLIFLLAEFIIFQPNVYDNIKLFFIWYLFMVIIVADLLGDCWLRLKGIRGRSVIAFIIITAMTISGACSVAREIVSGTYNEKTHEGRAYQLYNEANVAAANWISENTPPTSVFLSYNNHNNTISSLTGRNIYVGTGTFLYYHGVHYQEREALMREMFTSVESFENNYRSAGIDYVYVGDYERGNFGADLILEYFIENLSPVYDNMGVMIFKCSDV